MKEETFWTEGQVWEFERLKADLDQEISVVNAETENITNLRKALEVEIKCSKSVHDKLKNYLKQ